jgi:hypothetical protein
VIPSIPHGFEQTISKPRLDSYRGYFRANLGEAIGLYMWNTEVASKLGVLISYFEIALRNNTHQTMSSFYSHGSHTSCHWYDVIVAQLKPATREKIAAVRGKSHSPSPDEIVSRVTFGFWPAILSSLDKRYHVQLLAGIFPGHPLSVTPQSWAVKATRVQALAHIYEINDLRNRLAHHEPLWKFAAIKDSSVAPARIMVPASQSQADTLARFQRLMGLLDEGMAALSQNLQKDLVLSSWRQELNFLLSDRGIERYRKLRHVPSATALSPRAFNRQFGALSRRNQPVRIAKAKQAGIFKPD